MRRELRKRYAEAMKTLARATAAMNAASPGHEFDTAYNAVRLSRLAGEHAREAYEDHLKEHGCGGRQ